VFYRAWGEFADGSRNKTVRSAWEKCGLFPINMKVALAREGASASGVWYNTDRDTELTKFMNVVLPAEAQMGDGVAEVPCVQMEMAGDAVHASVLYKSGSLSAVEGSSVPRAGMIVRAAVATCMFAQTLDASVLDASVRAQKRLKGHKTAVSDTGVHVTLCRNGNPDTVQGKDVTMDVISAVKNGVAAGRTQAQLDEANRQEKASLAASKQQDLQVRIDAVMVAVRAGTVQWTKFAAADVVAAANKELQPHTKFTKKGDAMLALSARHSPGESNPIEASPGQGFVATAQGTQGTAQGAAQGAAHGLPLRVDALSQD